MLSDDWNAATISVNESNAAGSTLDRTESILLLKLSSEDVALANSTEMSEDNLLSKESSEDCALATSVDMLLTTSANESIEVKSVLAIMLDTSVDKSKAIEASAD